MLIERICQGFLQNFMLNEFISLCLCGPAAVRALFYFWHSFGIRWHSRRFKKVHWVQREGVPCGTSLTRTRTGAASGTA
nr:MAG TPA: hypothetical protein [Caudoviricetes sp.]